jgi:hypothetical protein
MADSYARRRADYRAAMDAFQKALMAVADRVQKNQEPTAEEWLAEQESRVQLVEARRRLRRDDDLEQDDPQC